MSILLETEGGQLITTEGGVPLQVEIEATSPESNIQEFDFSVDLLKALLWQYNVAVNLQALLEAKDAWYLTNENEFWGNWINDVFNLATANSFGLAVWSIILGQPTFINNSPSSPDYPAWGFGAAHKNFDNGNFASNNGNTYQLPVQWARLLLQLRYFQLTSSGTVPETNRMLKYLFGQYGPAWLVDNLDMTQTYYFGFQIPAGMAMIFENFDVLPRPAGVKSSIYDGSYRRWGFGPAHANFDNGGFVRSE